MAPAMETRRLIEYRGIHVPLLAGGSTRAYNFDSDLAIIFLTRCSKAVYWTLVQYSEGHRTRGSRVGCRGKSPSSLHTLST